MSDGTASGTVTGTAVELEDLGKTFAGTPAVVGVSAILEPGSFTALLGPSGCGKSTTLAMIAGLLTPDTGDVRFDRQSQAAVAAERRPVGLVLQKPLLFPHLDVAGNVGFGLRMRRIDRAEIRRRVDEMLDQVQLGGLARRRVGELSGGQEQRVSLARALVLRPRVLLLDEPFSALDASLRIEMRRLVRHLHEQSGITTVFVTHDQTEAVQIADRIALMLDGRLVGHDSPAAFYIDPPSLAAARFFGVTNEVPGVVSDGVFSSLSGFRRPSDLPDGPAILVVRPETLVLGDPLGRPGEVTAARFAGTHLSVEVWMADGHTVVVQAPVGSAVTVGASTTVGVPAAAGAVFPAGL